MTDKLLIIETALSIRPNLSSLLDETTSAQVRQQLDLLLQNIQMGEDVEDDIWELLTNNRKTRRWVTDFQPDTNGVRKGPNASLPGPPSNMYSPKFKCPHCDESWNRDRIGRPTPLCRIHKVPLELVS